VNILYRQFASSARSGKLWLRNEAHSDEG
jgi:hypothetical protein